MRLMALQPGIERHYTIEQMDCADCASHIEQVVSRIEGVQNVHINFINGRMVLSGDGQTVSDQQIVDAVHQAGYKAIPGSPDISVERPADESSETRESRKPFIRFHSPLFSLTVSAAFLLTGIVMEISRMNGAAVIVAYLISVAAGGVPIARKGWSEARLFKPGMNLLMTVAVSGAMVIGEWTEAATVVFLFALAQYLEVRSMEKARRSINNLMNESPVTARLVENGSYREVAAEKVQPGQMVAVKPGEKIPSDGIVSEGSSFVNQATITGEPLPVSKGPQDRVYAGTLNTNGYLVIKVDRHYADTTLQRVIHLVMEAQSKKAPKQAFIDRFAAIYTPAVIILAILVAVLPTVFFNQAFSDWFYRALVLLVIACPCALVISTPVTIISGLTSAIRKGVLIKGGLFLENFSHLKAIAFDKTGTLTEGRPSVQDVIPLNGCAQEQLLTIAGSLEFLSPHPIAGAITEFTGQQNLEIKTVKNFQTIDGKGVEGEIDGEHYVAGNHRLFEEKGWCDSNIHQLLGKVEDEKHTAILIGKRQTVLGILSISDSLRPAAEQMVAGLKRSGLEKIVLLTGDNHRTAEKVAAAVGISDYRAELLPEDKLICITDLKKTYGAVAMVGDGVNDAPSLAASDIGIAMGTGSADAALDTADIVLMKDDLSKIHFLANLSRLTGRIIRQNIFLALALKFTFLVLAVPGLATLWMAVIADMGASLLVIFNGLRTLR